LDLLPELVNRQAKRIRDYLHRIERWVRLPALQSAQVRLIEAAALPKFNLAQSRLDAKLSNASAEALGESLFHPKEYPGYALRKV
jgi:hypothetical protein